MSLARIIRHALPEAIPIALTTRYSVLKDSARFLKIMSYAPLAEYKKGTLRWRNNMSGSVLSQNNKAGSIVQYRNKVHSTARITWYDPLAE